MGDSEINFKESKEKPFEAYSAMSQELESSQFCAVKPDKSTIADSAYIDCDSKLKGSVYQKKEDLLAGKCYSIGGYSGRFGGANYFDTIGRDIGRFVGGSLMAFTFGPPALGYAIERSLDASYSGGASPANLMNFAEKDCYKQIDWNKKDSYDQLIWNKKDCENKLFAEKQYAKDLDFAPIPTLAPMAARIIDRVDTNGDGIMTAKEIKTALNGDVLNDKEKSMLDMIKKSKKLIDEDRDGITLSDVKEFDSKVIQYKKELSMARKFAPELGNFAQELHQKGKLIDKNHDGSFSKEELISFYLDCKKEFSINPTEEGKDELAALNWGITNYDRYTLVTGRPGDGQINPQFLETQLLREMDRAIPKEERQDFLSQSDRWAVERYEASL